MRLFLVPAITAVTLCLSTGCNRHQPEQTPTPQTNAAAPADLVANTAELSQTVVTPVLETPLGDGKNVLWCSTFQLAWNELRKQAGGSLAMVDAPPLLAALNASQVSREDLDAASYVAVAGLASPEFYDKLRQEITQKFAGRASPELLQSAPATGLVAYAYLYKSLPFEFAFTRHHSNLEFDGVRVDSFGITQFLLVQEDEAKQARQVSVVDYVSNDDFLIELKTLATDDRLLLAKISPMATLAETIQTVQTRVDHAKPTGLRELEDVLIPVLNFDVVRDYGELTGRRIQSANAALDATALALATQSIRFRLDERGAVLKSEGIAASSEAENLRRFVFDKAYLILLQRRAANHPYFALWAANAELLVGAQTSRE